MWTEATALFWQQTLAELRASGKTIVFGAALLEGAAAGAETTHSAQHDFTGYLNAALVAGAEEGIVFQRIPVPIGMWKPFSGSGVPLNLNGSGIARVGGRRIAVLICYEQLLSWPILRSAIEGPSILIAIANDYWTEGTPIPRCQFASISAWSRLFRIPVLTATNQ